MLEGDNNMIAEKIVEMSMSPHEFLIKHQLSQEKMAELIGVNTRTVQRWLSGERNPSTITLKMLAMTDRLLELE
jgi:DNA-binding transcriptional regulator YiaG